MNVLMKRVFAFILALFCVTGCDKNEDNPLRIVDSLNDNGSITLYYPSPDNGCITIDGGERPYRVSCDADFLDVYMDKWPNAFEYDIKGTGEAIVTVSDAKEQSIRVAVHVKYREELWTVTGHDVKIIGEQLTAVEKKELTDLALASIPVGVNGVFSFVYTEYTSGVVYIYPHRTSSIRQEGTFEFTYNPEENTYGSYSVRLDEKEYTYLFMPYYPDSRASGSLRKIAFYEELTDCFKDNYPTLEGLYSVLVIE